MVVAELLVLIGFSSPLWALTAVGARRRDVALPLAVLAGIFFPITWAVWYLRDEHPHRKTGRRTA